MLNPDYLLHISEGAEEISEKLHSDIIKRVVNRMMIRIGRGEDYLLTATDKWQIENLQQAGYLLEDIQAEIAKATKLQQTEIAAAMEDAGVKALEYDDKIYQKAGLSPVPLTKSPELIRLMQRDFDATLGEWRNFTRVTADRTQELFLSELDRAYHLVSTGALSYSQAVSEVINNIVSDGIKVTYNTGHTDTIETATLRAVRTGISQATAHIQMERMNEMGVDLVITSSHLGARPLHQEWQGQVFSRSGRSSEYPDFIQSTGYGSVSGLCGVNCRHSFSPYFEGMDNPFEQYDSEENQKQYEKEQYQRTLERRIRSTKREVMGLKEAVDSCPDEQAKFALDMDYQKKALLLQKQSAAYNDYCQRNNLKPLSDRVQIARWDRQQAAAARGAAKRYESAKNDFASKAKSGTIDTGVDIEIDEFTPCLRRMRDNKIVDTGVFRISPTKDEFKDWEFDWTIPEKNGYSVYEIKAEGDYRTQGLIALKPEQLNRAMHIDIVEAAPFNNPHNKIFVEKQYNGVGGHLFAEAVKQSYEAGFEGAVYFTAKTDLIEYYRKELGAILVNSKTRTMFIDEEAAKKLYDRYYGGKE
jgi:hypothetical protein